MFRRVLSTRDTDEVHATPIPHMYTWRMNREKTADLIMSPMDQFYVAVLDLYKGDQLLWTRITSPARGIGIDNSHRNSIMRTFCMHDIICLYNNILTEQGDVQYTLPGELSHISDYAAYPWVLLDNFQILFNLKTRRRLPTNMVITDEMIIYAIGFDAMILSECKASVLINLCNTATSQIVFLYKDVCAKLSSVLGVLPMDALNDVYRLIKC